MAPVQATSPDPLLLAMVQGNALEVGDDNMDLKSKHDVFLSL
jgi:hypothetical protein